MEQKWYSLDGPLGAVLLRFMYFLLGVVAGTTFLH